MGAKSYRCVRGIYFIAGGSTDKGPQCLLAALLSRRVYCTDCRMSRGEGYANSVVLKDGLLCLSAYADSR